MAVSKYNLLREPPGAGPASTEPGIGKLYLCDTEAELPASGLNEGVDSAYTKDTDKFWIAVSPVNWSQSPLAPAGSGEANTGSNVGSAGTGGFDAKVGVDLQLRKLNALSTKVSIALDAGNKKVDFDVPDATTSAKGAVELATDREDAANVVVQGNDARLDPFVASGASHATGLVPDPGASAGTTKFLREDATWVLPAGGSPPTGTGFRHVTGGVEDAAAKLADTADINDNQITDTKLRDSAGTSVIGKASAGTGDPADIAAGSDGDVLRRAAGALAFGAIPEASVTSLVSDLAAKASTSHNDTHATGGADAFSVGDLLDAIARVTVRKNTGADAGSRRRLNLIEGTNVTLTVADDAAGEEVDVTIAAAGGSAADLDRIITGASTVSAGKTRVLAGLQINDGGVLTIEDTAAVGVI